MIRLLPDTETLAIAYLKSVPEIAAIVGERVVSRRPSKAAFPMLEVSSRIGGNPIIEWHLGAGILQIDAWGRNRSEARTLIRTAHAALAAWTGKQSDGSVITGTQTFAGVQSILDPNLAHWLFRMQVFAHP